MPFRAGDRAGPRPLAEIAAASTTPPVVRLSTRSREGGPLRTICEARGVPVIDVAEEYAEAFVRRYAERYPSRLVPLPLDADNLEGVVEPASPADELALRPVVLAAAEQHSGLP